MVPVASMNINTIDYFELNEISIQDWFLIRVIPFIRFIVTSF